MHNRLCIKNIFKSRKSIVKDKVVKKLHKKILYKIKENDSIETLKQFNRNCSLIKYTFQDFDTSRKICTQFQVQEVTHILGIHTFATDQISQIGIHQSVWFGAIAIPTFTEERVDFLSPSVFHILFVLLFSDLKEGFSNL